MWLAANLEEAFVMLLLRLETFVSEPLLSLNTLVGQW